jgi:hypothetical protein
MIEHPADALREEGREYADGADRPLGTYIVTMGTYMSAVTALGFAIRRSGTQLPKRVEPWDAVVLALATHKIGRLIAKDPVTSPLRAPFTRFKGTTGPAELKEEVRSSSAVRHGVGELVTCPFCIGQWAATALVGGLVLAPRATRLVAGTFAVLAGADLLQFAYSSAEQAAEG